MVKAPRRRWRTFKQARVFVRKLKLKSAKEWEAWAKTKHRPANIPSCPHKVYRDSGWVSFPDFLGYKRNKMNPHKKDFLPFEQARVFVRKLKLKSWKDWEAWRKTKHRPANSIPSTPQNVYRDSGWVSLPDFLGYKRKDGKEIDFLPFKQARVFARKLKLKSQKAWEAWAKTKHRPANIPSHPDTVYRDSGWVSWPNFLGYKGTRLGVKKDFLPFKQARVFARKLKLKSRKEWEAWAKTKRPANIPSTPRRGYRDSGWVSYPDFLGYTSRRQTQSKKSKKPPLSSKKKRRKRKRGDDSSNKKNKKLNISKHQEKGSVADSYERALVEDINAARGTVVEQIKRLEAEAQAIMLDAKKKVKKIGVQIAELRKKQCKQAEGSGAGAVATLVSLAASGPHQGSSSGKHISDLNSSAALSRRRQSAEEKEQEKESDCCPSCWTNLSSVSVVRTLPCGHALCAPCLNDWARRREQEEGSRPSRSTAEGGRSVSISCPTCRDRSRFVFAE